MAPGEDPCIDAAFDIERNVAIEIELKRSTDDCRRQQGEKKQQRVQPIPLASDRDGRRVCLSSAAGGVEGIGRRSGILGRHDACGLQRIYCSVWSSLPGLNRTALPGGMDTSAPVRGLRPIPVLRGLTLKTPKPRSSMRSPCSSAFFMDSNTVSTAISALVLVMPVRLTTSLMMSSLIKTSSRSSRGALSIPASVNHMIGLNLFPCQATDPGFQVTCSAGRRDASPPGLLSPLWWIPKANP